MEKELDNILNRFPEHRGSIMTLFKADEAFRSLCEDYLQCKIGIANLDGRLLSDIRLENEYKMLCLELEREALFYLQKNKKEQ